MKFLKNSTYTAIIDAKKLRGKKYDDARNMAGIICALPAKVLKLN